MGRNTKEFLQYEQDSPAYNMINGEKLECVG